MSAALSFPTVREVLKRPDWTDAEIDVLRQHYPTGGRRGCVPLLPQRTERAIHMAAFRRGILGPLHPTRWTKEEDKVLRSLWGEASLEAIVRKIGRPRGGVYLRAIEIGLEVGVPQGCESIDACAARCGFERRTMLRVLAFGGVHAHFVPSRSPKRNRKYRSRYVDAFRADEAVAAWMASESVTQAADRRGLGGNVLRSWLLKAGVTGKPTGLKKHWRVPTETIDRVIRERLAKRCPASRK